MQVGSSAECPTGKLTEGYQLTSLRGGGGGIQKRYKVCQRQELQLEPNVHLAMHTEVIHLQCIEAWLL